MHNTFQCPNCGSNNLIGQTFCITCGNKLEYSCPDCGNLVDPSLTFCTSCGSTLAWIEHHQPEPQTASTDRDQQQAPIDNGYQHKKSDQKGRQRWPIGLIVSIVVLLVVAGLIFITDIFDLKIFTLPTTEEPITSPPPQTPSVQPAITPTIVSFDASPTEILLGESIKVRWNVTDATAVTINQDIGEVQLSGELTISPKTSTIFKLTANNKDEIVTRSVSISVIENISAVDIVLTEEDVEQAGFEFDTHSEPSEEGAISTFHVLFDRGYETLSVFVYVFKDIPSAEEFYLEIKYNNRGNITGIAGIGDVGYFLTFTDDSPVPETYSIRFIKHNVYVNITGLENYDELESFGKVIESRIE